MNGWKNKWSIALIALLAFGFAFTGKALAQPGVSIPVESFYNELAPYGRWAQYPGYGNVWLPNAGPDFQPYASNGHWVVTEYGNTWVSDYDWGWAPFHYGRWIFDQAYGGWLWIPGTDWGPAWVSWRSGGGYYGWAPLGPGVNINVNINIPAPYWTFVPQVYITSPNLYSYCVPRPRVVNIYQNTTIINNVYQYNNRSYFYGPQRVEIERVTRRSVPVYRIDQLDRPGRAVVHNGSVGFYRPNPSAGYGRDFDRRDYNRPDPFDNNRRYSGNNGGYNAPNPGYSRNNGEDRRSGYSNGAAPNGGNNGGYYARPDQPSRSEPNWGASRGNTAPPDVNTQRPDRTYQRLDQQPQAPASAIPAPQARPEGNFQRMPENRGQSFPQRIQETNPRPTGDRGHFSPGERSSRGPR